MHEQKALEMATEVKTLLDLYASFVSEFKPFTTYSETAQYMLFTRSCNAFRSASILCREGLFIDSYNSARVGLESGWLALILRKSEQRALEWLTLVPDDTSDTDIEKKYRSTYGSLSWIRREISINEENLKQRTNIYQLLSTKSHANAASTFFVADSIHEPNDLCLYPPQQLDSAGHRHKFLKGILYCLKYIIWDIQLQCDKRFGVNWSYDSSNLFNVAGVAYADKEEGLVVVPEKVNAAFQSMILRKFVDIQAKARNA
ncbi:hypothetical protein [Methylococcus capsulatus]|nr:hypothetical protein [Methylococcus capsulatus]QXP88481.1 hypothetical protein KW112_04995 [Methylococcus capsulatus]QXP94503.1 hypothetical protein KW113_04725 [Methylococcus capsulatus]